MQYSIRDVMTVCLKNGWMSVIIIRPGQGCFQRTCTHQKVLHTCDAHINGVFVFGKVIENDMALLPLYRTDYALCVGYFTLSNKRPDGISDPMVQIS